MHPDYIVSNIAMITHLTSNSAISIPQRARPWTGTARQLVNRILLLLGLLIMLPTLGQLVQASEEIPTFQRVPTQFIAALGNAGATSGTGAESWGLWRRDPGPRGVWLTNYEVELKATGGVAPAHWKFDIEEWWLDENGLIMEKPVFPVPPGKYIVTGDREKVAMLTIFPRDENGAQRWELGNDAKLYDVTHLPCRTARYTPTAGVTSCSPVNAPLAAFRVTPGAPMPMVDGCIKQDYAVLFIIAEAVDNPVPVEPGKIAQTDSES